MSRTLSLSLCAGEPGRTQALPQVAGSWRHLGYHPWACSGLPFPTKTADGTAVTSLLRCSNGKQTDWLLCSLGGIAKERLSAARAVGSWALFFLRGALELTRVVASSPAQSLAKPPRSMAPGPCPQAACGVCVRFFSLFKTGLFEKIA